ncbi:cytochrome (ubi)quinol oxidase subunit III [Jiella sp. M17.18]|uniref:cytochrome (ubi)quinol oxidase subunit III n=1 Tax=Jiella sp. M17.18 TaxID=3234247 RepID=UPI0034DDF016
MSSWEQKHPGINLGTIDPEAHEEAEELVFGFWVYLMSDMIIFAMLFATYAVELRGIAGGPGPKDLYDIKSVSIETGLLLMSSFTFGMASLAMKYNPRPKFVVYWLIITLCLGLTFLGFESHDFLSVFDKGVGPSRSGFISAYFALVSTHGIHVTLGCLWICVMLAQIMVFGLDKDVKLRLLRLGLFWHFLDVVWVGIFSIVYLQGLAG